jgi:tetratricopeptide (TPR) repeat protein
MKATKALKYLDLASSYISLGIIFLFPLYFNPFTANIFDLNKQLLLIVGTCVLITLWMVRNIITKSFRITISPVTGPLALFALIMVIASFSNNLPRMVETFLSVTNMTVFLTLFFITVTTLKQIPHFAEKTIYALVGSGAVLSILAVLETVGVGPGRILARVSQTQLDPGVFVTPAGSAVNLISFLIPLLVVALTFAITKTKMVTKSFLFAASAAITAAIVIAGFTILPDKPNAPVFLPLSTSWTVAVENMKSPKSFIIGVGANNYTRAFTQFRGVAFNQYEFWNTRFAVARNYPLHLFTTTGILGLAAWLFVLAMLVRIFRRAQNMSWASRASLMGISVILITVFVIPNNIVIYGAFFFLLVALISDLKEHRDASVSELMLKLFAAKIVDSKEAEKNNKELRSEVLPLIIGVPLILASLVLFYVSGRVFAADNAFKASLIAAAQNDGAGTYNNQIEAIQYNPYLSSYHRAYANTNLALANSLGSQENITDENRNNISELIRQAIREGQNAVRINPNNPANWETLAGVYRNLIGVAEGATEWAVSSYTQAINLDPTNPRLWVEVGGIFYQLQNYPQAINAFQRASQLKPNWANAHYNLANAYKENQELERAIAAYDNVLAIVEPTSSDYNKALEEQNALKAQLGEAQTVPQQPTAELNTPGPLPTPLPGSEQVELTEEDAPPVVEEETDRSGFNDVIDQEGTGSATPEQTQE